MTQSLTTGQFARRAGINRETIRFYERSGLLPCPARAANRYRLFSAQDLQRIRFISRAKALGFSLAEIGELLAIADGRIARCADVEKIARARLSELERQASDLERFRAGLRSLLTQCRNRKTMAGCPIIDVLSEGE
jgi:Hg(II)-responsive transcriptional regulator